MALGHSQQSDSQPYDSLLKHLFRSEAGKIVPLLLQGAELVSDKNIEIDRSTLRVDLALKILYWREFAILHFEAQSDEDEHMEKRISIYNAGLHSTYGLPVISILLYLFRCATVEPPYHVTLIALAKQALGDIHDIQVLDQLESEALRSPDEQYIHKQLSKYLHQNKTENTPSGDTGTNTGGE